MNMPWQGVLRKEGTIMLALKGKVVFVTGSARRVGRAIALRFADDGANVVIHHASPSSAMQAQSAVDEAKEKGVDAMVTTGDQGDPNDVTRMVEEVRAYYDRLDVMVNSAALFERAELLEVDYEAWQRVMDVNLTGPFLLTQHAARLMMESDAPGVIINIADNSGINGWASYAHHSISKAGVIMLTNVAALALAKHNIRVNCVVPGPVLLPPGTTESRENRIAASLPLGRLGTPDDVAQACIFFARNEFATGSILRVDGGEGTTGGAR
jgi:NAD(P)-dependent dehydrogenase (short-subunit alcohol dehydrogenase family)